MKKIQNLKGLNSLESLYDNKVAKGIVENNESGLYTITLNDDDDALVYISKNGRIDISYNNSDNGYFNKNGFENYVSNMSKLEDLKEIKNPIKLYDNEVVKKLIKTMESGVYSGTSVDNEDIIVDISKNNRMDVYVYGQNGQIRDNGYNAYGYQDYTEIIAEYKKIV